MPEPSRTPAENANRIRDAAARCATSHPIVLIDGPSGVGKSTTADALVRGWAGPAPVLVRLDDVYPGWSGLAAAGRHIGRHLLEPLQEGRPGQWQRYDWAAGDGAEWHEVRPGVPLLVEGCGAMTRANVALADLCVWIDGDPESRKRRALARDHGHFDDYWGMWDVQFRAFVAEHDPVAGADIVLDADGAAPRAFSRPSASRRNPE